MQKQHSKHNACARNAINDYPMEPP